MFIDIREWGKQYIGHRYMAKLQCWFANHWWEGETVPIRFLKEYPYFFEVEVLEHQRTNWPFKSTPYIMHINKTSVLSGDISLSEF